MYLKKIFILFIILLIGLLLLPGCTINQDGANTPEPPVPEEPEERNPKLGSHLNQLIRAEERGEAESFASRRDIELIDGSVRVTIECVPGQVEAAAEAAGGLGTVGLIYRNHVQAVVPITSLTTLADEESIRFIQLPWRSEEEASSKAKGLVMNSTE